MSETIVERLARFEPDWTDVERRSRRLHKQHLLRKTALGVGAVATAAILAGGAYAAARAIWSGHDMTPADIDRQATTVYNDKWGECDGHGHCKTVTGTHTEVTILPSMGVVFVLPDGDSTSLVPAEGIGNIPATGMPAPPGHPPRDDSGNSWGTAHLLRDESGKWIGGVWKLPLPGGGERNVDWRQATGAVTVTDSRGSDVKTTRLQTGDVVPLIPGTLADHPRTLDKAVTFDLPIGNRVIIFPLLNETYIDFVHGPTEAEPLPYDGGAKWGLTRTGPYNGKVPVTRSGGTWTAHLPDGLTRTISWHAGDSFVTVADRTVGGTTTTQVPIGHELPLVPFK
jgi:hypothetical protein